MPTYTSKYQCYFMQIFAYMLEHRISVSIIVSFIARLLGTLRGDLFCYSSISSAGVVLILPGFTIRTCTTVSIERRLTSYPSGQRTRANVSQYHVRVSQDGLRLHLHALPGN